MTESYAPRYSAPEAEIATGRVRIRSRDGTEEVREVLVGDTADAWVMWAHEMRFSLINTPFIDIGGTVYRCETIDKIDPLDHRRAGTTEPAAEALQVALAALQVIGNGLATGAMARDLAHETSNALAEMGFTFSAAAGGPALVGPDGIEADQDHQQA